MKTIVVLFGGKSTEYSIYAVAEDSVGFFGFGHGFLPLCGIAVVSGVGADSFDQSRQCQSRRRLY